MTAPMEKTENSAPKAENTASSEALSAHVFSSPLDFLATLKNDYNQIANGTGNQITKNDLIVYSEHGSDPKGRTAAAIAAQHFTDFANLSNYPSTPVAGSGKISETSVTKDDLDKDARFYQGQIQGDQIGSVAANGAFTALMGLSTVIGGLGTAAAIECPPAFGVGLVMTLGAGGLTAASGYETYVQPGQIQQTADRAKVELNSWMR